MSRHYLRNHLVVSKNSHGIIATLASRSFVLDVATNGWPVAGGSRDDKTFCVFAALPRFTVYFTWKGWTR